MLVFSWNGSQVCISRAVVMHHARLFGPVNLIIVCIPNLSNIRNNLGDIVKQSDTTDLFLFLDVNQQNRYVYRPIYVSPTVQSLYKTKPWVCLSNMGTQVFERFKSNRKRAEKCNQISSTNTQYKLSRKAKKNKTSYP